MSEKSREQKLHLPTKASLLRFGAVASAATVFGAPAAEAKHLDQPGINSPNTYSPASVHSIEASPPPGNLTPEGMKAVREGAKVLLEMRANIRPNVASSAVLQLNAGAFLGYGPRKGSPGEKVPKGKASFMEFPQLAVVDGRIVARGMLNNGTTDDNSVNSLDSRWVNINKDAVQFYYLQTMDAKKGFPMIAPVRPGGGNNLTSGAKWFKEPRGMVLAFLSTNFPAKYAKSQREYWAADSSPGPKPRASDITKLAR